MVSAIIKFFNKEIVAINQAALLIGLFTLLSQVLGLVRDRMFTSILGAGRELDIYYASFQIPDLLFNSVATLVSVTVLLPLLLSLFNQKGKEETSHFFSQVFTGFFILIIFVCTVAFFAMPFLAPFVAPGFDAVQTRELIMLSRIILISPILLGISNLFGSITQMNRRFILFSISPVLYNFGIILGVWLLYPIFGLWGLGFGVILGAFLHMAIQIPTLAKDTMLPRFKKITDWVTIKTLTLVSVPRTLGLMIHSITLLVLISFSTTIGEGAVSIFRLSMNLQNVPLALIGASFAVAAFPTLARDFTNGDKQNFWKTIQNATKQIIFWSVPITVLFIVLRAQIVRVILGSQSFTWDDTRLTAAVLAMFVLSVTAQSLILLYTRAFYASGDTRRPVLINFASSAFIVVFSLYLVELFDDSKILRGFLVDLFRLNTVEGSKLLMLAFAYSIGSIINILILMFVFRFRFAFKGYRYFITSFFQTTLVSLVMGFAVYKLLDIFDEVFNINSFWGILGQGFVSGILGILLAIFLFSLFKNQEFLDISKALKRKWSGLTLVGSVDEEV